MNEETSSLPWTQEDTGIRIWHAGLNQAALKALAAAITLVHDNAPDSWSLLGKRAGSVALTVWGYSVISVARTRCHLILPGSFDEERYQKVPGSPAKETIAEKGSIFRLERLSPIDFLDVYSTFQPEIQEALRWLGEKRDKGTFSRDVEHRPDLIDALSTIMGENLPQPSYFDGEEITTDQRESDSWLIRQPSHPVIDWRNQHHDGFVRFSWPNPRVNLRTLPNDLDHFASSLIPYHVDEMAARRLYTFVHGIKVGDRIAVADGPYGYTFAAGVITGPYEYADHDPFYPHRLPMTLHDGFRPIWLGNQDERTSRLRYGWGPIALNRDEYGAMLTPEEQAESLSDKAVVAAEEAKTNPVYDLSNWPNDALTWFGDSIQRAHSLSPHSWAFRLTNGELSLYVNRPKMLAASPQFTHILVSGEVDTSSGLINPAQLSPGRSFEYPSTWIANIDSSIVAQVRDEVGPGHEKIVDILAPKSAVRPTTAGSHDQALVEALGEALGVQLPTPSYLATMPPRSVPKPQTNSIGGPSTLDAQFRSRGLTYTLAQLATFYTALQTKGFVVLSGISGTGKSKIAQGFVDLLPRYEGDQDAVHPKTSTGEIPRRVQQYMVREGRILVPVAFHHLIPKLEVGTSMKTRAWIDGTEGTARIENAPHTGRRPEIVIVLDEQLRRQFSQYDVGSNVSIRLQGRDGSIESLGIYPVSDVSNCSGTGKNSLFLAVRPDWRDSTSLLGYYNPLTETYEWTEFLRFLLQAVKDFDANGKDALAWFVILDEMNLAHVEYYFADILSIIESGRDDDGWSREPIRLTYPDAKTDNPPPHEIYLPPNLYIIGTVNMDETTHAFSPKVLDRAFTIELTDVDFSDYPPATATSGSELREGDRRALLRAFTRDGRFAQVSKDDIRVAVDNHPEIRRWLQSLNTRLAKDQFHFGYRVFDEIAQFIHNADENGMFVRDGIDPSLAWQEAFDHAVYMKVLPKFNGSHARLIGPLTSLLDWAKNPDAPVDGQSAAEMASLDDAGEDAAPAGPAPKLNRVATRVEAMIRTLEANGFVSFG